MIAAQKNDIFLLLTTACNNLNVICVLQFATNSDRYIFSFMAYDNNVEARVFTKIIMLIE